MSEILYREMLPGGAMWSLSLPRHRVITLTALDPGANVSALFYNAKQPLDRLNVPDTLKALHTAKLTRGHVLMSDLGHALVSVTEDSLGWHDPLAGYITPEQVAAKYGRRDYQTARNDWYRNSRDNFLVELGKYGLGQRDIVANVNFFSKVTVDDEGRMGFVPHHAPTGAALTLRTEMDVLCVFSNCPHPMAPAGEYPFARVEIAIAKTDAPAADDYCRNFRPECGRTLALTERLYL